MRAHHCKTGRLALSLRQTIKTFETLNSDKLLSYILRHINSNRLEAQEENQSFLWICFTKALCIESFHNCRGLTKNKPQILSTKFRSLTGFVFTKGEFKSWRMARRLTDSETVRAICRGSGSKTSTYSLKQMSWRIM